MATTLDNSEAQFAAATRGPMARWQRKVNNDAAAEASSTTLHSTPPPSPPTSRSPSSPPPHQTIPTATHAPGAPRKRKPKARSRILEQNAPLCKGNGLPLSRTLDF